MLEIELKEMAIKDKLFSELSIITLSLELEYFGCRIHNNCYMNYYVSLEKKPNSILHATARHTWERLTSNNTLIRKTITVVQLMNALDDYKARVIREEKKIENKRIEKMKYDKKIGEMYDDMFKKKENTCPQCEAVWKIIPNFCRNCGYCAKPKRPNDPVKNYIAGLPSRGVDKYRTYRDHILALDNRLAEFYEKAENQEKHIDDLMNTIKLKDDRIYEIEQDIIMLKYL